MLTIKGITIYQFLDQSTLQEIADEHPNLNITVTDYQVKIIGEPIDLLAVFNEIEETFTAAVEDRDVRKDSITWNLA